MKTTSPKLLRTLLTATTLAAALLAVPADSLADIIYVANYGNNTIRKFDSASGADLGLFASTGLNQPTGLAFDNAGNLFVSNYGNNRIMKYTPGGIGSIFATYPTDPNLFAPQGLAFDSTGNLYVANWFGNTIEKFTPQGVGSIFATGLSYPADLAFDRAGNLYAVNNGTSSILRFTPDGAPSVFATCPNPYYDPLGLTFDSAGNLFVANVNSCTIQEVTADGASSVFLSNIQGAVSLAFDAAGNLLVAREVGTIDKFAPDGTHLAAFTGAGLNQPFDIAIQVPEPSVLTLLSFGIPVLLAARRRKA